MNHLPIVRSEYLGIDLFRSFPVLLICYRTAYFGNFDKSLFTLFRYPAEKFACSQVKHPRSMHAVSLVLLTENTH